jgi:nitrous oxidase accessory protein NosD
MMKILMLRILPTLLFCSLQVPGVSLAITITKDTTWQGKVKVSEDVLIPKGVTLTVLPGTVVTVVSAESTKTDPEFISPLTEITVRGTIRVEGNDKSPVEFIGEESRPGSWAGIALDHGVAVIHSLSVKNAETGIYLLDGTASLQGVMLLDNRYGLVVQGDHSKASVEDSRISNNDYGLATFHGAQLSIKSTTVTGNRKKDRITARSKDNGPEIKRYTSQDIPVSRRYKDEAFRGDVVWQGRIEVDGLIRVPQGSRLIVMPGTVVEFLKKDTDGDGIGENGILIQGRLIAKGTKELPIIFRSAEHVKQMGDWDSINIMDSSTGQNLIENCQIEDAYRGLHFHYSNVAVHNTILTRNYRGIQFQESQVEMTGNVLFDNKSGIQGRDSDLIFSDNVIYNNYVGANFFRTTLTAIGNRVLGNWKEGMRIREGVSILKENLIDGNRQGLMLADMFYGEYRRNSFTNNLETGVSLKNADNVELSGNVVAGNGSNGLNIQDSRAQITGNLISDNAERGIGVQSFNGVISDNNIIGNGLYAIDLDGAGDVSAPSNWWGVDEPAKVIFDKRSDPRRGSVLYAKQRTNPYQFAWPLRNILTDTTWRGGISIDNATTVMNGAELRVAPNTTVAFSQGTGLLVKGRLIATGKPNEKILFTSRDKKAAGDWDEIQLEYATGSVISHCVFEYATWGLHSHFTNLSISNSRFVNNYGGMRFRSGPVDVANSVFENNTIGIRAYIGNAVIRENLITRNEIGLFVREKGGGLKITRNNIYDNSSYNIRVGDFNNEDVPAQDNWWGKSEPLTTFFDGRNEPGIGNVLFEPYRDAPVSLDSGAAK